MSVRDGVIEAIIGIMVGFIPILIKIIAIPNSDAIIGLLELTAIIGAINQLYSDDQEKVSALTLIHEYIHYRNKHKEIEVTEDKTYQEAIDTYKKLGYWKVKKWTLFSFSQDFYVFVV